MVRDGNVRIDISINAELAKRLRASLHEQGRDRKGGVSDAISEALEAWIAQTSQESERKR
jgi:metal-responsive CopG/Arc/MetJ family transcriptional regulator